MPDVIALVIGKNKKNFGILHLKSKISNFCMGYRLNPRKISKFMSFYRFLVVFQ